MTSKITGSETTRCDSEYGRLERVVLCPPRFMEIQEVINDVQKSYAQENIDAILATTQHAAFVRTLNEQGVETIMLSPQQQFPEQVFTRDIGFAIGESVFISEMACAIRQGEEKILERYLKKNETDFRRISEERIEGGDVIIDKQTIFVGVGSRTSMEAVMLLQSELPDHEVIPVPFSEQYLHLDCVFNILSEYEALIFKKALNEEIIQMLAKRYKLIEVNEEEQFSLGTNVLSIGNKRVFSLPQNKEVNKQLRDRGYNVIEVDLSEIIKSGGSFRCCTLPLVRS